MEQVNSDTSKITVSYLVSSYNHSAYIINCLESVKADAFKASEIIIIDDGSTDQSVPMIQSWINQNSHLQIKFIHRSNLGIAATLNELFKNAQGLYYRTVSSDDKIKSGSTQDLIQELERHPDVLVAFGDVETIDEKDQLIAVSHMEDLNNSKTVYKKNLKQAIISKWAVCGPCWLLKKDFYKKIGLFDESLIIEDWNMYLRLVAHEAIVFVDKIVASYRVHGLNTSRTTDIKRRIANLTSQTSAGQKNLNNFKGSYKLLLKAELDLLRAKVKFLSRNYILTGWYLASYVMTRTMAMIGLKFRKAI